MTISDIVALALFMVCWLGYGPLLDVLARRSGTLNDGTALVRRAWMGSWSTATSAWSIAS